MKSYDVCECGAPLQMIERPTPKVAGTEVLLKVIAAGVCHSDLHIWDGYYEIGDGKRLMLKDRGIKLPLTMGHENVGEVGAFGGIDIDDDGAVTAHRLVQSEAHQPETAGADDHHGLFHEQRADLLQGAVGGDAGAGKRCRSLGREIADIE